MTPVDPVGEQAQKEDAVRRRGRHRKGVPPVTIEWVQIEDSRIGRGFPGALTRPIGEIPRYIFEAITGDAFVSGRHYFIRDDHSRAIHAHPSYRETSGGHR